MEHGQKGLPVTVLSGFLGSGKTTLLNHLVHQPSMADALVVINEFGDIGWPPRALPSCSSISNRHRSVDP